MRTYDFAPLMRSTVGFDRLNRLMDFASQVDANPGYPPYNIEKLGEEAYRITMAVAGFAEDELDVTVAENTLTVSAEAKAEDGEAEQVQYLHRGIARRAFERRFELADTIKVSGAALENGLLVISLQRVIPEEKKPRTIQIGTGTQKRVQQVEAKAA
ncbi:MAG: Hsp20 family protein [Sneathiellaceae bacterium]